MCTICFYQDSRHEKPLHWIRSILGIGYVSKRNDGMSELRINGFKQSRDIVKSLLPFLRFKKEQAQAFYKAANLLSRKTARFLTRSELLKVVKYITIIQENNYATRTKKTKNELLKILGLTP